MRVQDVEPPMEATEAYRAQLELCDELWIPEDRAEREELVGVAIAAAQECHELSESARAAGDSLSAELHHQNAKNIFGDVVRLTANDMRAALRAKYPTLSEDEAQDVLQDAYLGAYRNFPGFNHDAKFHAWMYRITMNKAINRYHRRKRHDHEELDKLPPANVQKYASISVPEYDGDKQQPLRELLNRLKPQDREILWLRYVEGYTAKEVAEMVGKTESLVKVRAHRSLKRLRGQLEASDTPLDDVLGKT